MIAKTTFNNFDAPLVFGPRRPCTCPEKPRKLLSSVSSGSSGYSSGSSSLDLPDSPDSLKSFSQVCKIGPESPKSQKIIVPQPVPRPRRLQRPYGPGSMGKTHQVCIKSNRTGINFRKFDTKIKQLIIYERLLKNLR